MLDFSTSVSLIIARSRKGRDSLHLSCTSSVGAKLLRSQVLRMDSFVMSAIRNHEILLKIVVHSLYKA